MGVDVTHVIHPDDAARVASAWKAYVHSLGAVPFAPEFRMLHRDGQIRWVLLQAAPECDVDGRLAGHVTTITDITLLKQAQFALQQAHDHLEERVAARTQELELAKNAAERSDRVKTAFLSTMSHELRTPLNSILGFTDVILQGHAGPISDLQRRQLGIVRDSSAHLRALIEDVLDISRIEAGQIALERTEVDVRELVTRRIASFGTEASRKGIALQMQQDAGIPSVHSDRKRIAQILDNLLSNALKFTDAGAVTVELRVTGRRVEIVVADTGIGIAPDALERLFNPFTQVVRPGGRLREGTGLGLAISRDLARALGGDVFVSSELDRGSRFTLWLPVETTSTSAAAEWEPPSAVA
jgi:signal transduction histidine kinase